MVVIARIFILPASLLLGRRLSICADAAAIVDQSAPAVALSNFIVWVSIVMASAVDSAYCVVIYAISAYVGRGSNGCYRSHFHCLRLCC